MFQDAELPERMNWRSAMNYCEDLNLVGFSDWRLPTLEELRIAYKHKSKFRNIQDSWYWSSTISKDNTSDSWSLNFSNGNDGNGIQSFNLFSSLCKIMFSYLFIY